eukprot:tig00000227_g19814.t1
MPSNLCASVSSPEGPAAVAAGPGLELEASLPRDLRRALADRATPFAAAAARLLSAAFGAWGADLLPAHWDGSADAVPLASHREPGAEGRPSPPVLSKGVPAARRAPATGAAASGPPEPVEILASGPAAPCGLCLAAAAAAADDGVPPSALIALYFDGEGPRERAARSPLLLEAAALVAAGIEARRPCPLEAVARVVRRGSHDLDLFARAAAAVRDSLGAARCCILVQDGDAAPTRALGSSPADAGCALRLSADTWEDLRRGARFREGPVLAVPIRHRGRLLGALVAEGVQGRPLEGELEEAMASCAWGLAAAVRDLDWGPAGAAARRETPGPEPFWEAPQDEISRSYRLLAGITRELNTVLNTADLDASLRMVCDAFSAERVFVYKLVDQDEAGGSALNSPRPGPGQGPRSGAPVPVAEYLTSPDLPSHKLIPSEPEDAIPLIGHLVTNFSCSVRNVALFPDVQTFVATSPLVTDSMRRRAAAARTRSSLLALCVFSGTPVGACGRSRT